MASDVARLEAAFCDLYGVRHTLGLCSGTAGAMVALLALGVRPGDEVVLCAYTWPQLAAVADALGLRVRYADCDSSGRVSPHSVGRALRPKTRAVLVCHLFGNPADMPGIVRAASAHGVPVVEDCSQALFASVVGRRVGLWGSAGFASVGAGKILSAGEGGLLWTSSTSLYGRAIALTQHPVRVSGEDMQRSCLARSLSLRMHPAGAASALRDMRHLEERVAKHQAAGDLIRGTLKDLPGITLPEVLPGSSPVWQSMPVVVSDQTAAALGRVLSDTMPAYLVAQSRGLPGARAFDASVRYLRFGRRSSDVFPARAQAIADSVHRAVIAQHGRSR
jgi:dTDP-4-amino-4,6-dideoxygalactose transaminase